MTNSRQKGARIEREAAAFLSKIGFPAERAARNGVDAGEDVFCPSLAVVFEVKGDEKIDVGTKMLDDAMQQAIERCTPIQNPMVLWKKNRTRWRLTYWSGLRVMVTVGECHIAKVLDVYRKAEHHGPSYPPGAFREAAASVRLDRGKVVTCSEEAKK